MNGRIYDPMLARFLSADPVTESPFSTQGWNRYAYVGNSPTNFTDPSGYCFLSCGWKSITRAIGQALIKVPILRTVIQIAAVALCGGNIMCGVVVSGVTSAAITGLTGGNFSQSLRAGLISATTALAFSAVGSVTGHNPAFASGDHIAKIAGHAAVGCASAAASGGNCGQGAASGAVGAFGAPLIGEAFPNFKTDPGQFVAGAAASATLGGIASIASGGKFATGASTAAFGYLFNACGGPNGCAALFGALGTAAGAVSGTFASAACNASSTGACLSANPWIVSTSMAAGAAAGSALGAGIDAVVHGNSAQSPRETEVYHLINRSTGVIDKIGITSYPDTRYSQAYYEQENVRYETIKQYSSRYPAMVHENISLTHYRIMNKNDLPRLNKATR